MFCFNHASAFYTNNKIVEMLIINKFKALSLNRKSYRKFTLSWFSVTCFKHVGLLWPISALDKKQAWYWSVFPIYFEASIHWAEGRLTARSRDASKPRDSGLDISNRSEIWLVYIGSSDACQISERYNHHNTQSRGFKTSRDLAVRRFIA